MTSSIVEIIKADKCTGCGACSYVCPNGAIEISTDKDGFIIPFTDEEKCTNYGLCKAVCPVMNCNVNKTENPASYTLIANDEIRRLSSSSGAFTLLAKYIFSLNKNNFNF